ncbi:hypothetical protein WSM22_28130 [Cytophagales bacterium WSM2-2]|nr:hypothetical protein WSM22_28130 [Cytophagales bacterium WSM2-2]
MSSGVGSGTLTFNGATPFTTAGGGTNNIIFNGSSSTVSYNRAGVQTVFNVNYTNLTLSNSGVKTLQVGTTTIGGALTLSGTASATAVIGLSIGSVTIGGGTTFSGATFSHSVSGDWTNNGGTFTSATSTVTFNGTGPQAITGTSPTQTFNNIIVSKTAGQTLSVGGSTTTLNVANLTQTTGNFTAPTTLAATGNLSISSDTYTAGTNTNIGGNFALTGGAFAPGAGTVTFNKAAGTQTLNSGGASFNNISHTGAGTLQLSTNSLATGGTFTTSAGSFDANGLSSTVTGLTTVSGGTYLSSTATQTFNGGLTISGGTFTGSTGAVTSTNVTLTSGTMTAPSGTFSVSGNWSRSAATFTPGANTVTFTGSGTQTLNSGGSSFNNISHTGSGTLQLITNSLTTGGTFTNSAGTFDANSLSNTVTGLATISGGIYSASTALQTFNGGLTISGGTFTGSTGDVATVNLTLSSGTLTAPSGVFNVSGNWSKTAGTFTPGGNTVTFTSSATQTLNSGGSSFNNISHSGTGTLQLLTNSLTTGGTFTNSNGTFDANGLSNTVTGLTTVSVGTYLASTALQTFNGGLTISGGTFTGSTGGVTTTGLTLSSGTLTAPSGVFNVSGNWSQTGGTFTPGANTVTFTGGSAQTLNSGGSSFGNISHTGAGTLQLLTNSLAINGTFTNASSAGDFNTNGLSTTVTGLTTLSGGNYLASTALQTFNGGLTISGGTFAGSTGPITTTDVTLSSGTLTAPSGTFSVSGNWSQSGGTFAPGTNTVTFTKPSGTQTFNSGGSSFGNIAHSGSGTLQLTTSSLTTGGSFTNSSGIFDANGQAHTVTGLATISSGTYLASTASQTFNGGVAISGGGIFTGSTGDININGNLSIGNASSLSIAGSNFSITGLSLIGGGSTGTLSITSSTGTKTFGGLVSLSAGATWDNNGNSDVTFQGGISRSTGTFNAGAGVHTFDTNSQSLTGSFSIPKVTVTGVSLTNNTGLTVASALSGTGSFIQSNNATLVISGTSGIASMSASSNGNAVTFNGTLPQTINSSTYNNLTISQSGGNASLGGSTTVNGSLTISLGNVDLGANDLTIGSGGSITGSRIIISGAGTLKKIFTATGVPFTFPIGDVTLYTPVIVNVTGGSFSSSYTVGASVTDLKHPSNASTTDFLSRYWTITQSGVTGAVATITGTYDVAGDVTGSEANIVAAGLNGTFNQTSNPWVKLAVGALPAGGPLTATGAVLTNGQPSYFTGVQNATLIASAGTDKNVCTSGTATLGGTPTASGGTGGYVYSWTPSTGLSATNIANPVFTAPGVASGPTSYMVTVTDANGFSATSSVNVTVIAYPVISQLPLSQTKCFGSGASFSVTASGTSLSYQWFRGATPIGAGTDGGVYTGFATSVLNISSVNGLNGNQYSVVVTETTAPGCALSATGAVTLTVESLPTGSLSVGGGSGVSVCSGSSASLTFTLTGTGPYDVDYTDGTSTFTLNNIASGSGVSVSPSVTKTYTITRVKDNGTSGGCLGTSFGSSATVTVVPYPVISQLPLSQTKCFGSGASFSVTASGTSLSYQWFRGATPIGAGTDGGVYTGFATSVLNISSVNGLNGNQYSVVVTETTAPGCALSATGAATLTVESLPTGSLSVGGGSGVSVCSGSSASLTFTLTGTGPYDVDYTDGTSTFTLNNIASGSGVSVSPSVTKTYTITRVKDNGTSGGCLGTSFGSSATVTVVPYPVISQLPLSQTKCFGSGASFSVTASGTSLSYQWFRGATPIGAGTDGGVYTGFATSVLNISSVNGLNGNQYSVVVTETTAPGCALSATGAVTLTVESLPTGSLSVGGGSGVSVCSGSSASLTFTLTGTGPYDVDYTDGTSTFTLNNIASGSGVSVSPSVTKTYTITRVKDKGTSGGCLGTSFGSSATVTVVPYPVISQLPLSQTKCFGSGASFSVTASGTSLSYQWFRGATPIGAGTDGGVYTGFATSVLNISSVNGLNGNQYSVVVTETTAPGCALSATGAVTLTVESLPTGSLSVGGGSGVSVCSGSSASLTFTLTGTGPYDVDYTDGTSTFTLNNIASGSGVSVSPSVTKTYTITRVKDNGTSGGCLGTSFGSSATVTVVPYPVISQLPLSQTKCFGSGASFSVTASGTSLSYQWFRGATPIGAGTDGGVYTGFATSVLNISSVNGLNGNQYSVVVTETTAPGCALSATGAATLTVESLPTGSLSVGGGSGVSVCSGSSASLTFTLTGTGPYDVDYTDGTSTFTLNNIASGSGVSVSPSVTKTYTITRVKDKGTSGGCLGTSFGSSATVTVVPYPVISQLPLSQTKCFGSGASFSVTASGTSLSYQWFRGATPIGAGTDGGVYTGFATSVLNISSVNGLNGNQYSVVVTETTAPGCALSATGAATLTVESLPTGSLSVGGGSGVSVCSGSSASLTFTLTGTGPYDVDYTDGTSTFTLNNIASGSGVSVSPSVTKTYTITRVKDKGTSGGCLGTSFGSSATVTVVPYPVISQLPLSQTKCFGSGASFSVTASGTSLSYQWFRGATPIGAGTDGGVYTGFATSVLNISSVNGLNGNQYSVVVTETTAPGCALSATGAVTLTVESLPTGSLSVGGGSGVSVCSGSSASLTFTLTGTGPYDVDYTDGTSTFTLNNIASGSGVSVSPSVTKTYTITRVKDNGTSGGCLGTSFGSSATVTVVPYPVISQLPLSQTKCFGSGASFSVTASGTSLSYQWFRGATPIGAGTDGGVYTGFATSVLNISSVNGLNGNQYSVVVTETTAPGCALSATGAATLTVESLPTGSLSVGGGSGVSVCSGSSASLTFTLTGTGPYDVDYTDGTSTFTLNNIASGSGVSVSPSVTKTYTITRVKDNGTSGGCLGTSFGSSATVTVNSIPVITSGQVKTICSGDAVNYKVTLTPGGFPAGTIFNWSAPTMSDASVQGSAGTSVLESASLTITDILVNVGGSPITATYNITPTGPASTNCIGSQVSVVITINPAPVVSTLLNGSTCSDVVAGVLLNTNGTSVSAASYTINSITPSVAYTGTWKPQVSGNVGTGPGNAANALAGDKFTNQDGIAHTVTYNVTPISSSGCSGAAQDVVLTVNPEPVLSSTLSAAVCSDSPGNITLNTNGSSVGATSYTINSITVQSGLIPQASGNSVTGAGQGVSAIHDDKFTNPTVGSKTVTYNITPVTSGCAGDAVDVVLTINPEPVLSTSLNATVCSGTNSGIVLNTNGSSVGATGYTLNSITPSIAFNGSTWKAAVGNAGTGALASANSLSTDVYTNLTGTLLTVTYNITPKTGSCVGDPYNVVLTINPAPVVSTLLNGSTCSDVVAGILLNTNGTSVSAASYTINSITPSVAYTGTWKPQVSGNVGTGPGNAANALAGDKFTNQDGIAHTVTYNVTPISSSGCSGAAQDVVLTVNPEPVLSSTLSAAVCSDSPGNITLNTNGSSVGATSYTINSITVQSGLIPQASGNSVTGAGQGVSAIHDDKFTNPTVGSKTVTYNITPVTSGCAGDAVDVVLTINPEPVLSTSLNATVCSGTNSGIVLNTNGSSVGATGYTLNSITPSIAFNGSTWKAAVGNAGTGALASANSLSTDVYTNLTGTLLTVTYNITPKTGSCVGDPYNVVLTINPAPVVSTLLNGSTCSDVVAGILLNTNGTSVSAASYTINSITPSVAYTGTWKPQVSGNVGTGPGNAANALAGDKFTNQDGIAHTVTYNVTPISSSGCSGAAQDVVLTVNPEPVLSSTLSAAVCSDSPGNITLNTNGSSVGATSYTINSITVQSGLIPQASGNSVTGAGQGVSAIHDDKFTNPTVGSKTVTYNITPVTSGCAGDAVDVVLTINPEPVLSTSLNATVCSGTNSGIVLNTNGSSVGATGYTLNSITPSIAFNGSTWKAAVGNAGTGALASANSLSTDVYTNLTGTLLTVTYNITPKTGSCVGDPYNVVLTINPAPVVSTLLNGSTCSDVVAGILLNTNGTSVSAASYTINSITPSVAYTGTWKPQVSGNVGTGPGNAANALAGDKFTNQDGIAHTVTYNVTPISSSGCSGAAQDVVLTVNPEPVLSSTLSAAVCSDSPGNITLNTNGSSVGATSYTINSITVQSGLIPQASGNSVTGAGQGVSAIHDDKFTNPTVGSKTVTYNITPVTSGCAGDAVDVVLTINPEPVLSTSLNATVCSGTNSGIVLNTNGSSVGATGYTLNSITPSIAFNGSTWKAAVGNAGTGALASANSLSTDVYTNLTGTLLTVTYNITPKTGSCVGDPYNVVLTINPAPVVSTLLNGSTCSDVVAGILLNTNGTSVSAASYTINSITPSVAYTGTWKPQVSGNVGTGPGNAANALAGDKFTNQDGIAHTVTYNVTPISSSGCSGAAQDVVLTVNPEPVLSSTLSAAVCSDSPGNITLNTNGSSVGATSYTINSITVQSGLIPQASGNSVTGAGQGVSAIHDDKFTNPTVGSKTVTYNITPVTSGCAGDAVDVVLTINPEPVLSTSLNATVCSGTNSGIVLNTNGSSVGATGYTLNSITPSIAFNGSTWKAAVGNAGTGALASANSLSTDVYTNLTGTLLTVTYNITPKTGSCVGDPYNVVLTINPAPVVSTLLNGSTCSDVVAGILLNTNGTSVSAASYTINSITPSVAYTGTWKPQVSGNVGTGPGNAANALAGDKFTNQDGIAHTVTYNVTPISSSGCSGAAQDVVLTVNPEPVLSSTLSAAVCSDSPGNITLNTNGSSVGATSYTINSITVQSGLIPQASGNSVTGAGQGVSAIHDDKFTNPTVGSKTVTYNITPVTSGCAGDAVDVVLTINPEPVLSTSLNATVCSGTNSGIVLNTNGSSVGATGYTLNSITPSIAFNGSTWKAAVGNAGTGALASANSLSTDVYTNLTGTLLTVTYNITPKTGSCVGDPYNVVLTINPAPVVSTLLNGSTCSDVVAGILLNTNGTSVSAASYTINSITPSVAYTGTWKPQVSGNVGTGPGNAANALAGDKFTNQDGIAHTVTYNVTPISSSGCSGAAQDVVLTVNPEPVLSSTLSAAVCSDSPGNITLNTNGSSVGATSYTINSITVQSGLIPQASGNSVTGAGQGVSAIHDDKFTNPTVGSKTVTYNITPVTSGCAGDAVDVVLTINPEPVLSTSLNATVCSGTNSGIVLNTNGSSVGATGYTLNSITPSIAFNGSTWKAAVGNAGTGALASANSLSTDVYTNLTGTLLTVTYNITPKTGSCVGDPYNVVLTINPAPVVSTLLNGSTCSDVVAGILLNTNGTSVSAASYTINSITPSVAYTGTWKPQVSGNVGTGPGNAANALAGDKFTNQDGIAHTVTYNVTPISSSGCSGAAQDVVLTVNPEPVLSSTLSAAVCSDSPGNITLNTNGSSVGATSYTINSITVQSGLIPQASGNSVTGAGQADTAIKNDKFTNPTSGSLTVTYGITPVTGSCAGDPVNVVLTINPEPVLSTSLNASVCSGVISGIVLNTNGTSVGASSYTINNITLQSGLSAVGGNAGTGAGQSNTAIQNDKFTNLTNAPLTVTYNITPKTGSCVGDPYNVVLTINPAPVVSTLLNGSTCSDVVAGILLNTNGTSVSAASYTINSITPSVAYTGTWKPQVSGNVGTGPGNAANALAGDKFTNQDGIAHTVTYNVTPISSSGCSGAAQDVVLTVNPEPVLSSTLSAAVCSDSPGNITLNTNGSSVGATSYTINSITVQSGLIPQASGNSVTGAGQADTAIKNDKFTNPTSGSLTVTYGITPVTGSCAGDPVNVVLTINPEPVLSTSLNASVCSGVISGIVLNTNGTSVGASSYTINNITLQSGLSAVGGNAGTGAGQSNTAIQNDKFTNLTNALLTVTYNITPVTGSCVGDPYNVVLTVKPQPAFSITNNTASICSGTTTDITLNSSTVNAVITLTSVNYGGAAGGTQVNGNTFTNSQKIAEALTNPGNTPLTISYTFSVAASGCSNPATQSTSITLKAMPVITNTATELQTTICSATALNFTPTSTIGGTTYTWTSSISGPINPTSVTAGPSSTMPIANSPVNTGNVVGTVTYTITPAFNGCSGTPVNYVVTVNPVPDIAASNQIICSGATTNVTIANPNNVSGTSFSWIVQSSSNVTGASLGSGASINQVLTSTDGVSTGTVTYRITPSANGCNGSFIDVTVTVNPVPVITDTAPQLQATICSGTALNFIPTSTIGSTTYTWNTTVVGSITGVSASGNAAITNSPVNSANTAGTVTYHITPTVGTCNGIVKDYIVTVQPVPSANGTDIIICSGSPATIPINASPQNVAGTTFSWVVIPTSNVAGASADNGSTINQNLSLNNYSVGSVVYRITPTANGCNGPTKDINATINPIPLVDAGADYAVCHPSTIAISGTIGGAATSGTWQIVTGSGTISASSVSGSNVTATYTVNPTDIATTVVFRLVTNDPDNGGPCTAVSDELNVAVNRIATVTLPSDYTVCEPNSIALTGTIGGSATTGLWSIVTGAGTLSATNVSGTTVTANYSVAPSDIASTVTFRLTSNDPDGFGPCTTISADINITINRAARVSAPANLALCRDTPGIALGGSIGGSTSTTVWTGGAGTFSNVNSPSATYFFKDPNEVNTTVLLTLTALDPDGSGPCTSVFTQTNLKINPLPVVVYTGFPAGAPPQMAENNSPITLTGNQIGGLFTISPSTSNIGSTTPAPVDKVTFDPGAVTLGNNFVTYTYTDVNGCTNSNTQQVLVNPVTTIDFTVQTGYLDPSFVWEICALQNNPGLGNPSPSLVKLIGNPAAATGGAPETNFTAGPGLSNPSHVMNIIHSGGEYYIETNGLQADTYIVTYTYKNAFNAITFISHPVKIHAAPVANISVANNCIASAINFNDASSVNSPETIIGWKWDFGDSSTPDTRPNPSHSYSTPSIYTVNLLVTSSFGCSDITSTQVRVGAVPVPKFIASSICNNDSTKFKDLTQNPNNVSRVVNYEWRFGDGKVLIGDSTAFGTAWNKGNVAVLPNSDSISGTYKNPYHKYKNYKTYAVTLKVITNDGCNNSYSKNIFILKYSSIKLLPSSAYTEDFENANHGWQVESLGTPMDSSWIWTKPNGKYISGITQTGNKSWWTGLNSGTYNVTESSAVDGPCFNLSHLNRPMIAMDYWVNTPKSNNDGAVLQYSVDGGNTWANIGVPNQGINWYSDALIVSNPGSQPVGLGPYGWSGPTQTKWTRGAFGLDSIPKAKRGQVRIRVAFAGDASKNIDDTYSGFAFDNVFVGEKTKKVAIEHFTNAQTGTTADKYFNDMYDHQITFRNDSSDFTMLQYHVRFPQPDVFDQGNNSDASSRALYYGIQKSPYSVMDGLQAGKFQSGDYNQISKIEIDRRALKTPQLRIIQIDTVNTGKSYTINPSFTIQADTTITFPLFAQIALVEDPVVITGSTNPGTYRNVVRKLLFGSDGVVKNVAMQPTNTTTFTKGEIELNTQITNPAKLSLVAFVQNFTTKEILQSYILAIKPKMASPVTGIERSVSALESIQIYPNPANGRFNFSVSGDFVPGSIWKIADQRGVNVQSGDFGDAVKGVKTVDVSGLTNGVYIVLIGAPGETPVYKKLIVLNSN